MVYKQGIEIVIIATDEPQFEKCRAVAKNAGFEKWSIYQNIVPASEAHNKAVENITHEFALFVGGDMILFPGSYMLCKQYVDSDEKVISWNFGLRDDFLKKDICCCRLYNSKVAVRFARNNTLRCDIESARDAKNKGYREVCLFRQGIIIGTHFYQPDDKQIFRRFFRRGLKGPSSGYKRLEEELYTLYIKTKNKQYPFAVEAYRYGLSMQGKLGKAAKQSHDYLLDNSLYNEFMKERSGSDESDNNNLHGNNSEENEVDNRAEQF